MPLKNRIGKRLLSVWEMRLFIGPVLGGLIGLLGGIAGFFIGLVIGYLVQELLGQFTNDYEIRDFMRNPSKSHINESEKGLASFSALGVLVAGETHSYPSADTVIEETVRMVKQVFPPVMDSSAIEQYCRIAWQERKKLNPDLLLENLAAHYAKQYPPESITSDESSGGELSRLGAALTGFASTDRARAMADRWRSVLDPSYKPAVKKRDDPWKILDISPDTPLAEIKSHYRLLAAQFHPDVLQALDEQHRETAARAFIAIQDAYREIISLHTKV